MKINITILCALIFGIASYTLYQNKRSIDAPAKLTAAPEISFMSIDNQEVILHGLSTPHVIVHFWASWCAPCIVEFPEIIELAKTYPQTVTVIAAAVQDKPENIEKFINKSGEIPENLIIAKDYQWEAAYAFGTKKLPETYILDPQRNITYVQTGARESWRDPFIKRTLDTKKQP